jgi:hypothetical protein
MTLSFDKESEKEWAFSLLNSMTSTPLGETSKGGLFGFIWRFFSRLFGK